MKNLRLDVLIPLLIIGYIAYCSVVTGEFYTSFIATGILIPMLMVIAAMTILSYGMNVLLALASSIASFFTKVPPANSALLSNKVLNSVIVYSYASAMLITFYAVVMVSSGTFQRELSDEIYGTALAFFYAFIIAEFIVRPLKHRLTHLQDIEQ